MFIGNRKIQVNKQTQNQIYKAEEHREYSDTNSLNEGSDRKLCRKRRIMIEET